MMTALQAAGSRQHTTEKKASKRLFTPLQLIPGKEYYTKRLGTYIVISFLLFFLTSVLNLACDMYYSLAVTIGSCILTLAAWFILKYNTKSAAAYVLLVISVNLAISLLTLFEGYRSGSSLYFFTSTLSFIFLINGVSQKLTTATLVICFSSFFITYIFAKEKPIVAGITDTDYQVNFFINLFLSFGSTVWMAYYLAKDNWDKQKSLKNQQVFLDTIFNSSISAEIIMDMESDIIINSNKTAQKLFRSNDEHKLNGHHAFSLFIETDEPGKFDEIKEKCKRSNIWEGELTCLRKDGTAFPGSVSIVQFLYKHKHFKKITISDISEKKQMLKELQEAKQKAEESAEVKSRFLSQMSHELRTPLNGIIGTTNLLLQEDALPQQQEHLDILRFSSEHMLRLVNEVLDLSKLDAQKIKLEKMAVDFREFINNIASGFKNQCQSKGLDFNIIIEERVKNRIITDPTRLNQVLTNLLSNAIKFTHKGSISIYVKAIAINSDWQQLEFNVIDTGIGISADKQQHVFEPFTQADIKTTRKYGGTGLGLNISKEIIKLMNGDLQLESAPGKGSRFHFTIKVPIQHYNNNAAVLAEKTEKKKIDDIKVLIAEDNMINMKVATKFLDKWGVQYVKAFNGKEAVDLFNSEDFDAVLMDLEMPEMDGYEAIREIRKKDAHIPAFAFTAAVFEDMKDRLKQNGFTDYVQKPFSPDELYKKLQKLTVTEQPDSK